MVSVLSTLKAVQMLKKTNQILQPPRQSSPRPYPAPQVPDLSI